MPNAEPQTTTSDVATRPRTRWWTAIAAVGAVLAIAGAAAVSSALSPELPYARRVERIERLQTESQAWLRSIPAPSSAGTAMSKIVIEPTIHEALAHPELASAARRSSTS